MDFRESDLVLNVSKNVDPAVWDEGKYAKFFDIKTERIRERQRKLH